MKCWSRSTLGLVIGILNVLSIIPVVIYLIYGLVVVNRHYVHSEEEYDRITTYNTIFSILIVVCLIMLLITGLFIVGIIKRRHKLMLPWLILNCIAFVAHCGRLLFGFIAFIVQGVCFTTMIVIFVVSFVVTAFSACILWSLYNLFLDIRNENREKVNYPKTHILET